MLLADTPINILLDLKSFLPYQIYLFLSNDANFMAKILG